MIWREKYFSDLSDNGLAVCVEDGSIFGNTSLPSIHTLKFASNRIRTVPSRAFENFPDLQSLDLTDNPIASIQEGAFESVHLKNLYINTSSLVCDCELRWFPKWLSSSGLDRSTISTVCLHPTFLQGIDITMVDVSNLTCVDNSPRVRLVKHPVPSTKALLGSIVQLHCMGYGASPLEITWKVIKSGVHRILIHDPTTDFYFNRSNSINVLKSFNRISGSNGISLEYLSSEMKLSDITFTDEAEYQCVVRNHFGSAYSLKSKIIVYQLPEFLVSPSNVSIIKGGSAKLKCSAHGVPPPVVKWRKDGGEFFPAAVERRLHVKSNEDTLYVINVSLADAGLYTCHVSNEAGNIEKSAYIFVFEDFRPQLEDRRVVSGMTVFFTCLTNEQPQVRVEWLHNGKRIDPLTAPSHMTFKADNQILVINEAHTSDSGSYGCEYKVGPDVLKTANAKLIVDVSSDDWNKCRGAVEVVAVKPNLYIIIAICTSFFFVVFSPIICIFLRSRKQKNMHRYSSVEVNLYLHISVQKTISDAAKSKMVIGSTGCDRIHLQGFSLQSSI
ncbi:unnamed protein product [Dracunculus medinensis]|uniref:Ig-like domain-containing protein n=1 Tax=Dracunculus medinensis TaxID=318479 RepID=A0A0N4U417_DRAME|nr:unnamed protein product [Dracunculus medinensis]